MEGAPTVILSMGFPSASSQKDSAKSSLAVFRFMFVRSHKFMDASFRLLQRPANQIFQNGFQLL